MNIIIQFKKGDLLKYKGGSKTKYLTIGKRYRTTWDGVNAARRVAVVGNDKKRIVMHSSFFTN